MKRPVLLPYCCTLLMLMSALHAAHTKFEPFTISANTTWQDTVTLLGDVVVDDGILTIRPGTMIYFGSGDGNHSTRPIFDVWHVALEIRGQGAIRAVGTPDSVITFIKADPGGFGTLKFSALERDSLNILRYCRLVDGFRTVEFRNPSTNPGESSRAFIDHCVFTRRTPANRELMYVTGGASPVITNTVFERSGAGIFFHGGGRDVIIRNTVFRQVSCAIFCGSMDPWYGMKLTVDHCTFHDINGYEFASQPVGNGFGIITVNRPGTLSVHNTVFSDLARSGIRDYNVTDPNIDELWTVINDYNCFYRCDDGATMDVPEGAHSLVDTDPQMAAPDSGDFRVWSGSPCWKAGSDGLNMGAFTDTSAAAGFRPLTRGEAVPGATVRVHNNPFRTRVFFTDMPAAVKTVGVFDAGNALVASLPATNGAAAWDGRNAAGELMPAGAYVYRAGNAAGTVVRLR